MTPARPIALAVFAASLTLGSLADAPPAAAKRANGRAMLTADFHVHAFPGDGVLPAWELRAEARRRGVDVIAVTNHNQSIAARLPAGEPGELPLVIPGQEITAPAFHLVAVGIREAVDWRLGIEQMIAGIQAQGGVAIAAHPVRESWRLRDPAAWEALDGTEAVHALGERHSRGRFELLQFYRQSRAANPDLAPIGSSDFHTLAPLARCFTYVFVDEVSVDGVLEAVRRGRTVAADNRGTLVGDPALVEQARAEGRPREPRQNPWQRLAVVLAIAALAAIVVVR